MQTQSPVIDFVGYLPDVPVTTEGVLTDCQNIVPSVSGFKSAPSAVSAGLPALASQARGGVVAKKTDGSQRIIVGTQTKLFEIGGTSWVDFSQAGNYTGGTDTRWRFAQFGNITIASNRADEMQASTAGAFADLGGGAPKASIVETVGGFVMAFDTNDGVNDYPDGWACSALFNHASWTPSIATQAANGRLLDTPGGIRGAKRLGSNIVAYKERSMYLGSYQGPPFIWSWELVPGEIGALSHEAVVNIGTAHIFMGFDNFYYFDGTRPVPIGNGIRDTVFAELDTSYAYRAQATHDVLNALVYFYYPAGTLATGAICNKCVVYNYRTQQWGRVDRDIQTAFEYATPQVTYDGLGGMYSTYDSLPDISYDSPFWVQGKPVPAIIDASATLRTLTGIPGASSFTTHYFGDDFNSSDIINARLRFDEYAATADSCTHYRLNSLNQETPMVSSPINAVNGRYDLSGSANWHQLKFNLTGRFSVNGMRYIYAVDGLTI